MERGDVFRDTYNDRGIPGGNKRTIEVLEVLPNGIRAKVLTEVDGRPVTQSRTTVLQLKTLRAGYVAVPAAVMLPAIGRSE